MGRLMELQASLLTAPSLRMPQRAQDSLRTVELLLSPRTAWWALSFRVQPWLCPFTAGDLGKSLSHQMKKKASLFLCLRGERTQRDDGNCKDLEMVTRPAKYEDLMGSVLVWWG